MFFFIRLRSRNARCAGSILLLLANEPNTLSRRQGTFVESTLHCKGDTMRISGPHGSGDTQQHLIISSECSAAYQITFPFYLPAPTEYAARAFHHRGRKFVWLYSNAYNNVHQLSIIRPTTKDAQDWLSSSFVPIPILAMASLVCVFSEKRNWKLTQNRNQCHF